MTVYFSIAAMEDGSRV